MNFNDLTNRQKAMMWYQANPGGGGETYPTVLDDGNTVAWFDYTKGITEVTGVSKWEDQSGNGNDLEQATGSKQPVLTSNGILFDGDFMSTATITLTQPEFLYAVFRQVTWTDAEYFFDGKSAAHGMIRQNGTTPNIQAYAGSLSSDNSNLAVNTFGIVRVLFNGVSSKLQVNETAAITGDFGSTDMNGLVLGGRADDQLYGHVEFKELILRKVSDTSGNETDIYNYLASKYGI